MSRPKEHRLGPLLRDVGSFQIKLLLDAARDIVLSPVSLAAALLDLLLIRRQAPRYFRAVQRLARHTEDRLDLWSSEARDRYGVQPEAVDGLLAHVEAVVRDPKTGGRKARVLRRWVEMQVGRRVRAAGEAPPAGESPQPASTAEAPGFNPDGSSRRPP